MPVRLPICSSQSISPQRMVAAQRVLEIRLHQAGAQPIGSRTERPTIGTPALEPDA